MHTSRSQYTRNTKVSSSGAVEANEDPPDNIPERFIDNTSFEGGTPTALPPHRPAIKDLGLMVNLKKSQMVPKKKIEFLGLQINSASLKLTFQSRKCGKSSRMPEPNFVWSL